MNNPEIGNEKMVHLLRSMNEYAPVPRSEGLRDLLRQQSHESLVKQDDTSWGRFRWLRSWKAFGSVASFAALALLFLPLGAQEDLLLVEKLQSEIEMEILLLQEDAQLLDDLNQNFLTFSDNSPLL